MKLTLLWDTVDRVRHYGAAHLPSVGGISLVSLSSTIMEKQFLRNSLGDIQLLVKDALWWYSHLGIGTWIYQRKHLHSVDTLSRLSFSVAGSLVFNQGVMLLLAMFRLRLPNCKHVTVPLGIGACFGLVHLGRMYGQHCDSLIPISSAATTTPKTATSTQSSKSSSPRQSSSPPKSMSPSLEPEVSGNSLSLA